MQTVVLAAAAVVNAVLGGAQKAPTGSAGGNGGVAVVYLNADAKAEHLGSQSCAAAGCHEEIWKRYAATPMGHSMGPVSTDVELARVPEPVTVYSATTKRHCQVYRKGSGLYQRAYQMGKKGHRVYETAHRMDYVVGGGLTDYSHLLRIGDWFFFWHRDRFIPNTTRVISHRGTPWMTSVVNGYVK